MSVVTFLSDYGLQDGFPGVDGPVRIEPTE